MIRPISDKSVLDRYLKISSSAYRWRRGRSVLSSNSRCQIHRSEHHQGCSRIVWIHHSCYPSGSRTCLQDQLTHACEVRQLCVLRLLEDKAWHHWARSVPTSSIRALMLSGDKLFSVFARGCFTLCDIVASILSIWRPRAILQRKTERKESHHRLMYLYHSWTVILGHV